MAGHPARIHIRPYEPELVNVTPDLSDLPTYEQLLARTDGPPGASWYLFGKDDQLGTLNLLRLNSLTAAAAEVRTGEAFSLDLPSTAISTSLAPTRSPAEHHIFERTPSTATNGSTASTRSTAPSSTACATSRIRNTASTTAPTRPASRLATNC